MPLEAGQSHPLRAPNSELRPETMAVTTRSSEPSAGRVPEISRKLLTFFLGSPETGGLTDRDSSLSALGDESCIAYCEGNGPTRIGGSSIQMGDKITSNEALETQDPPRPSKLEGSGRSTLLNSGSIASRRVKSSRTSTWSSTITIECLDPKGPDGRSAAPTDRGFCRNPNGAPTASWTGWLPAFQPREPTRLSRGLVT